MTGRINIILKNTGFLYVRLFLTMILSFYTSRVILQVLGVNDFGVYSVVGSVTATFASLKTVFSEAVLRYLNYEKGLGNTDNVRKVFNLSILIHVIVALIFFVVVEIVGLWLINNKLNIPHERFEAALFVFHISVVSSVITIFTVPFDAVIIANEKINVYSIVSIFDALVRLGIILIVPYLGYDYLMSYAFLLLFVPLSTLLIYVFYCKRFDECSITKSFDQRLFKELSTYSSWNFLGNFIFSLVHEALNMMLNVYGGVVENAARNISYQARNAVSNFSNNALVAVKPFVIQSSAINGNDVLFRHTIALSKLSFYLSLVISAPLILFCEQLLDFWLAEVPTHAVIYTQLGICAILFRSLHGPISLMYMSLARIKRMTLVEGFIFMMSLFIAWVLLLLTLPLWSVFALLAITEVLTIIGLAVNARYEFGFIAKSYFKILSKLGLLFLAIFLVSWVFTCITTPSTLFQLVLCCFIEVVIAVVVIYVFLENKEKKLCKEITAKLCNKYIYRE